jgi:hypothetical protein
LNDPATGRTGVFERNQETEEGRLASLGRFASLGVFPSSSPMVAVPTGTSTLAKVAASPITQKAANVAATAATTVGSFKLAELLGISPEVSSLIGGTLGLGEHSASGGNIAGPPLQHLANWLNARAAAKVPAGAVPFPNYARPNSIPGLLSNAYGLDVAQSGYPYSTP